MTKSNLRIVFAGTPDFAVPCLQALLDHHFNVVAVFTQPDRPQGRGQKIQASPVKKVAQEAHIPVIQPISFKEENAGEQLCALKPDLMIVVAYGLLLPQNVLSIPRLGCINVHASLLPRWRGAAPIQRAILEGDKITGITIMQMELGLDTGPMLYKQEQNIETDDTSKTLHDKLSMLGAKTLIEALNMLEQGAITPIRQDDNQASYAAKITKHEAKIDWLQTADFISRSVRAFNPWPCAYTLLGEQLIKIHEGKVIESSSQTAYLPGQIVSFHEDGIDVQTGENIFRILQLQLAGGRILSAKDFVHGNPLKIKVLDQFA